MQMDWTGEMRIEIYGNPNLDHSALWDHIIDSGKAYGMAFGSGGSMGLRRVEAGILDYDTDIDGEHHDCKIVSLPFYDAEKKIPRGLEVAEI